MFGLPELISLFQLMVPVMESNAMLMPLVLNRRVKSLVRVYAKVAGRETEGLVKVRKKGNYLCCNSLVFTFLVILGVFNFFIKYTSPNVLALIVSSCINEDCMYVRTSKATYKEL